MRKIIAVILLSGLVYGCSMLPSGTSRNRADQTQEMDRFITELMGKMTLEEKLGQLNLPAAGDITTGSSTNTDFARKIVNGQVGGIFNIKSVEKIRSYQKIAMEQSRLKIPLIFGMDVIHGYRTTFPIPLGLAASWDMPLIEKTARMAAVEASADGICWTFSPMVDITRDPRWGRIAESSGEDPHLGSEVARAMVKGYQGDDLKANNTVMACVKHFALYGASEAGRDYNTVDMSRNQMYNVYFPPYKAAVDAGVGSVMTSFNVVDGIPATGNRWLLTDVLRNQWGFDGFVVSDYTAVSEMINHGMGNLEDVSALSLRAGNDMDMVSEGFLNTLPNSLKKNRVTLSEINTACRRVLEAKYKLGLFDDPYKYLDPNRAKNEIYTPQNQRFGREAAAETFVLLKNEGQVLPLKKSGTIALIGPLIDNALNMPGTWSVASDHANAVTLLDGIRAVAPSVNLITARGANFTPDTVLDKRIALFGKETFFDRLPPQAMIAEAVRAAQQADVIVAALGESSEMSGESSSMVDISLMPNQLDLLKELVKTNKPIVLVLFTGRAMTLNWENRNLDAILNVWYPGSEAGYSIADALFGDVNPSGKLPVTFPQHVGQIPIYYNHLNTGRPIGEGEWFAKFKTNYIDVSNEPLYPFGYGLSYTSFAYSNLRLSNSAITTSGTVRLSVDVRNTGRYDGSEVVQLYIRDMVGSISRPVKELKDFQKIFLKAGETRTVTFNITVDDLKFYNYDLDYVAEPGDFKAFVGSNSRDVLEADFSLR